MTSDLVVGLDSSTTATKAIAWTRDGAAVAEGRAPIALSNPRHGWFEQDAAEWWDAACAALRQLTGQIDPARIAGLAVANQRETFGVFAADGQSLRPALVWLDSRAIPQQRRFGETFGAARVHAISGKPFDIIPCLYRMIWLREQERGVFDAAHVLADVHATLAFRLTGSWVTSVASADPLGLVDMRRRDWSDEILDAAAIPRAKLPAVMSPGHQVGVVTGSAAQATGLPQGLAVFCGGGDGQCAATGVNALGAGRAYVNLGTAVVAGVFSPHYAHDLAFRTEIAVGADGYICETCLRAGTFLVDWLTRELYGIPAADRAAALARLEAEAALCPPGSRGLLLLPYWEGSMTPHWDSGARGIIAGLSGSTRRGDVFRAVLEGIALDLAESMSRVETAINLPLDHYVAIGGGAVSDLWTQILADATARPIWRSATTEASSLGAAMAAAHGAGWFDSIEAASAAMASKPTRCFEPDPVRARAYRELRGLHAELWPLLAAWNRRLGAFTETQHAHA